MFKNVIFCTRHTGEQRELKTLPQVHPSHGVGLTPLLLQPRAPRFLCRQEAVWETVIGDLIFFFSCTHLKKTFIGLPCSGVFDFYRLSLALCNLRIT